MLDKLQTLKFVFPAKVSMKYIWIGMFLRSCNNHWHKFT